ncbi:MAG TPA: PQQ-binding-like beta-propeller repeat protein [Candidatus Limnocylindrales bacterium]
MSKWRVLLGLSVVVTLLIAPSAALAASTSPPTIAGFSPKSGPVGTTVKINGKHFGAPGLQVSFGGTMATPDSVSGTQIVVRLPPLAPTGKIQVKTRYGTATSAASFRVTKGIASFPKGAWAGQDITIAASGMPAFHDFTLKLDGQSFGGVATNANGQFSLLRTLPGDLTIGPEHVLVALDSITHVQFPLHVPIFGNWPQARDDPSQTGNGAAEFLINTSNVAKVHQIYATSVLSSPPVEDGGNLYLGYFGNAVAQFQAWAKPYPKIGWAASTDGPVTRSPAVAAGVVYAVSDDRLYALPENPSGTPVPLWTAILGDAAHPFAPVVADGHVYVADGGLGLLQVFDANGVTNCSGAPVVCTPLWFSSFTTVFGAPAVDAKSDGGTGDVYLSVRNNGINKVAVRTAAGANAGSSAALATTSLSGPAVAGGRVFVSGWSAGSSTATLYALDASTEALQWNSSDLGGSAGPTAVAVGNGHVFDQSSDGTLEAFKSSGCGVATCGPLWSGVNYGPGGTTPPTLANGVVYSAAGSSGFPYADLVAVHAFDANGCGSATCGEIGVPNYTGTDSEIVVVAGTVLGQGHNTLSASAL